MKTFSEILRMALFILTSGMMTEVLLRAKISRDRDCKMALPNRPERNFFYQKQKSGERTENL